MVHRSAYFPSKGVEGSASLSCGQAIHTHSDFDIDT